MGPESQPLDRATLKQFAGFSSNAETQLEPLLLDTQLPRADVEQSGHVESLEKIITILRSLDGVIAYRFGLNPNDAPRVATLTLKNEHGELEKLTFADLVWRELEKPGTLTTSIDQLAQLSCKDEIALFQARWQPLGEDKKISFPIGHTGHSEDQLLEFGSNPTSTAAMDYRRAVLQIDTYQLRRIRTNLAKFLEEWTKQMNGTPFDVLSSLRRPSELPRAILLDKGGKPRVLADLVLDASIEGSVLIAAREQIDGLTETQQQQLTLLRKQGVRLPTAGTLGFVGTLTPERQLAELAKSPPSEIGQYLIQSEMRYIKRLLANVETHLQQWRRVSSETTDLTPLEDITKE